MRPDITMPKNQAFTKDTMPSPDRANLPDAYTGWNGARSAMLGAAILQPILGSLD